MKANSAIKHDIRQPVPLWFTIGLVIVGVIVTLASTYAMGVIQKPLYIFVGIVGVISSLWIVMKPRIGAYILVVFIFLNFSDILEVQFGIPSINKALVALVFISVLANRVVLQQKPLVFRRSEAFIMLYILVLVASAFIATERGTAFNGVIDMFKDFAIMFIMVQIGEREQTWRKMQWFLVFAASLVAILSAYQVITGNTTNNFYGLANAPVHQIVGDFDSVRVTGPLSDPNFYAQILLLALPIALVRTIDERNIFLKTIAAICSGFLTLTIVFTYSRGGFLALIIMFIVLAIKLRVNLYQATALAMIGWALINPLLPVGYIDRILTLNDILPSGGAQAQAEVSFRGRSSEMIIATRMFSDHPLLGIGYKNYESQYQAYNIQLGLDDRSEQREAHSLYLEAASETGLLGLLALMAIIVVAFYDMHKAKQIFKRLGRWDLIRWMQALEVSTITYLVTSIFLHSGYIRYFWLLIAIIFSGTALAQAMWHEVQRKISFEDDQQIVSRELIRV